MTRADSLNYGNIFWRDDQIFPVTQHLSIGSLANHRYGEIGTICMRTIQGVRDLSFARNCGADCLENRCSSSRRVATLSLPADGPASTLITDVVGAFAAHVNSLQ